MNDEQLVRALYSVGMTAFIENLPLFRSNLSNADAALELQERHGWRSTACRTRVSHARRILENGREKDALRLIASSKLSETIRSAARSLL
jgi:hypothetical protein